MKTIQSAFQNLFRYNWLSLSTILVLTLMVVIFNLALSLNSFVDSTFTSLGEKVDIIFNLKNNLTASDTESFLTDLKTQPGVSELNLITPEEGNEIFSTLHPELSQALDTFDIANPFPTLVKIKLTDTTYFESITAYLKAKTVFIDTTSIQTNNDYNPTFSLSSSAAQEFSRIVSVANHILSGVGIVLIFSTLAITFNAVYLSLFTRRNEINIMRLVGATHSTIRKPFLFEGALISTLAVLIGNLLFAFFINLLGWNDLLSRFSLVHLLAYQILIAVVLGLLASFIATQTFLRRQTIRF